MVLKCDFFFDPVHFMFWWGPFINRLHLSLMNLRRTPMGILCACYSSQQVAGACAVSVGKEVALLNGQ
jgi:hypothetical protein